MDTRWRQPPVLSQPLHGGSLPVPGLGRLQQACAKEGGPPSFRHFQPAPVRLETSNPAVPPYAAGDMGGRTGSAGIRTGEPVRLAGGWTGCLSPYRTGSPMQETQRWGGKRLSLKGIGIRFLGPSPIRRCLLGVCGMGCGEAKTVEGALRSAIKRFRFAADRWGCFRVKRTHDYSS